MSKPDPAAAARALARASVAANDATVWFEALYRAVDAGEAELPWDRTIPNPLLVEWMASRSGEGQQAVVVGFGNGVDAEYVAGRGFATTAFEVSETAMQSARRRWPGSAVEYAKADLLALPPAWNQAFSLVVESLTIQSLPLEKRDAAIRGVRSLLSPGGTLLVIANAAAGAKQRDPDPPWPLTEDEVRSIAGNDIALTNLEHLPVEGVPALGRWRATFHRQESTLAV